MHFCANHCLLVTGNDNYNFDIAKTSDNTDYNKYSFSFTVLSIKNKYI